MLRQARKTANALRPRGQPAESDPAVADHCRRTRDDVVGELVSYSPLCFEFGRQRVFSMNQVRGALQGDDPNVTGTSNSHDMSVRRCKRDVSTEIPKCFPIVPSSRVSQVDQSDLMHQPRWMNVANGPRTVDQETADTRHRPVQNLHASGEIIGPESSACVSANDRVTSYKTSTPGAASRQTLPGGLPSPRV